MEENLLTFRPDYKLYKEKSIWLGTFLGGPLVAGYIMAMNYSAMGQADKAKKTWIVSIAATIVIFAGIFLIPATQNVPNYLIPLIYIGIAQMLINKLQKSAIDQHIEQGGAVYSVGRVILVGIVGLMITFLFSLIIVLLINKQ